MLFFCTTIVYPYTMWGELITNETGTQQQAVLRAVTIEHLTSFIRQIVVCDWI